MQEHLPDPGQRDSLHDERVEVISPAEQREVHIQGEEQDIVDEQARCCGQARDQAAATPPVTTGRL